MEDRRTAILVFSRTAAAESIHKRLANQSRKSHQLSKLFIDYTKKTIGSTQLPCFWISESLQRGQSFGEKITNAFRDVFAKGYKNVIAVGNDCLSLSDKDILNAARLLECNEIVIGPSNDGGAYLIGMSDHSFDYDKFNVLSWQSAETFESLVAYYKSQSFDPIFLDYKTDIDAISDWKAGLQGVKLSLKDYILLILMLEWLLPLTFDFRYINIFVNHSLSLRAPPIFQ